MSEQTSHTTKDLSQPKKKPSVISFITFVFGLLSAIGLGCLYIVFNFTSIPESENNMVWTIIVLVCIVVVFLPWLGIVLGIIGIIYDFVRKKPGILYAAIGLLLSIGTALIAYFVIKGVLSDLARSIVG